MLDRQRRRLDHLKSTASSLESQVCALESAFRAEEASLTSARKTAEETQQKINAYEKELKESGERAVGDTQQEEEEAARIIREIAKLEGTVLKKHHVWRHTSIPDQISVSLCMNANECL